MEKKRNLWVIPTDKPSRLFYNVGGALLFTNYENHNGVNIYITSDEEIKEGDWCYQVELNDGKVDKCYDVTLYHTWTNNGVDKTRKFKKIILTTDQDLINDGVQAIDDEFLEWFVKNPSCEEVEIDKGYRGLNLFNYKIIIPKEEPKQDWYCPKCQSYVSSESVTFEETHQICNTSVIIQEPKQETLEEVADKYFPLAEKIGGETYTAYKAFIAGAKWQQGRMYNEEDIIEFAEWIINQDWDETELNFPNNSKSTKELLQLWKEQKPKTVYYE